MYVWFYVLPYDFNVFKVVELNLSQNNFTHVPSKALSTIQNSLAVLDLSRNSIRTLNRRGTFRLPDISPTPYKADISPTPYKLDISPTDISPTGYFAYPL